MGVGIEKSMRYIFVAKYERLTYMCEVSITVCVSSRANKGKVSK